VIAATIPNCRAYDPAFAYELAVILDHGMRAMMERQKDEFYYLTLANENYAQPSMPAGIEAQIVKGMYRLGGRGEESATQRVSLLASGAILREVIGAADLLLEDFHIASDIYSVTSFSELAREAASAQRYNRLHPQQSQRQSLVEQHLAGDAPIVAASDYVRAYPQLIAPYLDADYSVLGTDGFGRSDTRAALRRFFEVDRAHIAVCALHALARAGRVNRALVLQAISHFGLDTDAADPWTR
jgi:pyruvate dehydrogenase E1 component